MYLVIAAGGNYVLENPQGSLVVLHERYIQLLRRLLALGVTVPLPCYEFVSVCKPHASWAFLAQLPDSQDTQSFDLDAEVRLLHLEADVAMVYIGPNPPVGPGVHDSSGKSYYGFYSST